MRFHFDGFSTCWEYKHLEEYVNELSRCFNIIFFILLNTLHSHLMVSVGSIE
jgi:hypothetical protein